MSSIAKASPTPGGKTIGTICEYGFANPTGHGSVGWFGRG